MHLAFASSWNRFVSQQELSKVSLSAEGFESTRGQFEASVGQPCESPRLLAGVLAEKPRIHKSRQSKDFRAQQRCWLAWPGPSFSLYGVEPWALRAKLHLVSFDVNGGDVSELGLIQDRAHDEVLFAECTLDRASDN